MFGQPPDLPVSQRPVGLPPTDRTQSVRPATSTTRQHPFDNTDGLTSHLNGEHNESAFNFSDRCAIPGNCLPISTAAAAAANCIAASVNIPVRTRRRSGSASGGGAAAAAHLDHALAHASLPVIATRSMSVNGSRSNMTPLAQSLAVLSSFAEGSPNGLLRNPSPRRSSGQTTLSVEAADGGRDSPSLYHDPRIVPVASHDLPFNQFTVLKSLGSGGTARVWLVMIKEQAGLLSGGPRHKMLVRKELVFEPPNLGYKYQAATNELKAFDAQLLHRHIAHMWHVRKSHYSLEIYFECDHASSLEQELVEASKLAREIDPSGQLLAMPEHHIACVIGQVAKALEYLHEGRGWIHRDIKPGNVLIAIDEHGYMHAQLIDFGSAKHMDDRDPLSDQVLITLEYAAPEYFRGGVPATDRAYDMWCLGATLFQLATGDVPFPMEGGVAGSSPGAASTHHDSIPLWVTTEQEPIIPRYVPPVLAGVIRRLLSHNVSKRLTAKQLLAEPWLSEYVSGFHKIKVGLRSLLS